MVTELTLRNLRPGDGPALAQIHLENAAYYHELAPASFRLPDADGLSELLEPNPLANNETALELVVEVDNTIVGCLSAHLIEPDAHARHQMVPYLTQRRLWIDSVGTLRAFWRRGVASTLVEAAEQWGKARGATVVMCDTWIGSPVSVGFWETRMGYSTRAVIFEKPL
ncbi:MAG TPA: GNAT family N-acetyltransferase [Gaiellaceae bacterium]|nr:GNAT family N-acetyltransferase [Gaiellaceae bacterium]